ncbi:WD repeat-containing protein 44-like isoform X2 [Durio zibethinus]|uniref:WD repeat-containing protein 44-like isoform X2 n=1 Tax=Durio zibethinus TaxID=66656 RepID=A0A6P6AAJ8_DURZI|nr:WD repeat-containing protein 44-like isoform X2 [Durio zibethinus]
MGSYFEAEEEEEDQFFDTCEENSSISDRSFVCSEGCDSSPGFGPVNCFLDSFDRYKFWSMFPESADKRRYRFRKWMDNSLDRISVSGEDSCGSCREEIELGNYRIPQDSGAVLRTSGLEDGVSSSQSFVSLRSNDAQELAENYSTEGRFAHEAKNLDSQMESVAVELGENVRQNGMNSCLQGKGSSNSVSSDEFERTPTPSPRPAIDVKRKVKKSWLSKLGAMAHIVDRHVEVASKHSNLDSSSGESMKRVRVHPRSKSSKELSSLYCGQEFVAHEGSILTMKFSLDGQFLATAGEDCIVRVWKIIENESFGKFDIQDLDSSCLYFRMNHLSHLTPLNVDKESTDKIKRLRKSSDSTCVILPPKVFEILEKPVHEFQGHIGEILALSWSKKGFLLSSSVDKTVRLWQVGYDRCLRVFSHNITSVAFNPMDDNYFISGSIDGKVRIWEVLHCQVIDYTDIRDIVTAVCYRPDGKGGIVGSMTGNCHFYYIIGCCRLFLNFHHSWYIRSLKLWICSKQTSCTKSSSNLLSIFWLMSTVCQFSPNDPSKVIITSADSLVRVLSEREVVCKLKASGYRIAASQISATFSQDGKQIISASEDSNVYIWNYINHEKNCSKVKNISSCESFLSYNASVAIPWCGIETIPETLASPELRGDVRRNGLTNGQKHQNPKLDLEQLMPHSSPDCFSLTRVLLESLKGGSPTWPEETLPNASSATIASDMCKFELKVLKSAYQSMLSSHKWGLVIVTASWDGRIRTYLNYGLPIRL